MWDKPSKWYKIFTQTPNLPVCKMIIFSSLLKYSFVSYLQLPNSFLRSNSLILILQGRSWAHLSLHFLVNRGWFWGYLVFCMWLFFFFLPNSKGSWESLEWSVFRYAVWITASKNECTFKRINTNFHHSNKFPLPSSGQL